MISGLHVRCWYSWICLYFQQLLRIPTLFFSKLSHLHTLFLASNRLAREWPDTPHTEQPDSYKLTDEQDTCRLAASAGPRHRTRISCVRPFLARSGTCRGKGRLPICTAVDTRSIEIRVSSERKWNWTMIGNLQPYFEADNWKVKVNLLP